MDRPARLQHDSQPTKRRRRKTKQKRAGRVFLILLLLVLVMGTGAVGYASWRVDQAMDSMTSPSTGNTTVAAPKENTTEEVEAEELVEIADKKSFSVLIMGRDYRPETGTNLTDVMIVAGIDIESKRVSMVSIPRDTKVRLSEINKKVKANEAYNYGEYLRLQAEKKQKEPELDGPTLAKGMAASLFDIPIDHYILVDFKSFTALVDEIGGINVMVEKDMVYNDPTDNTHIHLKAGQQHLSGKKALDWVRHRQDDRGEAFFSSDFDRNQRQKEAIKAIAQEMTTWKRITRIFDVMDTLAEHVETDLSKAQMKELFWAFKTFDTENMKSIETPNVYWDSGRLQTVIPKEDLSVAHNELQKLLN